MAAARTVYDKWVHEELVRAELANAMASEDPDLLNSTIAAAQNLGLSVKSAKRVLELLQVIFRRT